MFEPYKLATEGWRILTRYREAREGARFLLRWLAGALELDFIGIRYTDEKTGYSWEETVIRNGVPKTATEEWKEPPKTRAFPVGSSFWLLDDREETDRKHGELLDLLAEQWAYHARGPAGNKRSKRLLKQFDREDTVNDAWVAVSRRSRILLNRLHELSQTKRPLLLIGENGSGRSRLAVLIHRNSFDPSAPFLIGLDAKPAAAGTRFLPNWRDLPAEDRKSLLAGNSRIIASTLTGESEMEIRKEWDLLTGNSGLIVTVPSLKERKEDIPLLAGEFLNKEAANSGRSTPCLTASAIELLCSYSWPGNVRELKEAMVRSLSIAGNEKIRPEDLPAAIRGARSKAPERPFPEKLIALEYQALREELGRQNGNMTRTAHALGLTPRQVSWRVRKYGIDPKEFKLR